MFRRAKIVALVLNLEKQGNIQIFKESQLSTHSTCEQAETHTAI